jgi:hypothetical protein
MLNPRTLAPALLASALLLPAARAADVDPFVPADAEWVLHCNVKQLVEAPAVKTYGVDLLRAGLEPLKPLTTLGIDPLRDVHTVTLVGSAFLQEERALAIARGRFEADKLRQAADAQAWKALKSGDVTLYEVRDKAAAQPMYLAIPADGTVLLSGGKKYLAAAAAHDPKKPAEVSLPLRELVKRADARDDVWMVAVKSKRIHQMLSRVAGEVADGVTDFSGRIRVGDGVELAFSVRTKDRKTAEEVALLLDAAKAFAVQSAQAAEGAGPLPAELIDGCKISTDGGTATLAGRMSAEQMAKVLKKK